MTTNLTPSSGDGLIAPHDQPAKSITKYAYIVPQSNLIVNEVDKVANKFAARGQNKNRADRRATAKTLRSKATVSDKQHGNTLWLIEKGHLDVLFQIAQDAIRDHGMPPNDADVTVAHEAGHIIIGMAMGGTFKEAFIALNDGHWEGFSNVHIPNVNSKEDCNILTNPRRGWLLGLQRAGGIHGEMLIGRYHPASSIDEAFVITSVAHELGELFGVPMDWVAADLSIATMHVINENSKAFEIVCSVLLANRVLTAAEAAALPIVQFKPDELVPMWLVQTKASFKSKPAGHTASGEGAPK